MVFEPNDEQLWDRVKDTIRLFLRTQWRAGAMMGLTEDQAFIVGCGRDDHDPGRHSERSAHLRDRHRPVRPAEFVIFKIFQNTAESQS